MTENDWPVKKKVALYHPYLKERGGAEKLIQKYLEHTNHEVTIYTAEYRPEQTFDALKDHEIIEIGKTELPENKYLKTVTALIRAFKWQVPEEYDRLLVSETGISFPAALKQRSIGIAAYVHTPLRAALPEFKETYLEELAEPLRPLAEAGLKVFDKVEKLGYQKYNSVICNSETTKRRLQDKKLSEDAMVANPGVEPIDIYKSHSTAYKPFILYVSRFRRYKRQDLAIEAFQESGLEGFKLVLAGSSQEPEYIEELKEKAGEKVEIRTDVSEQELDTLYRTCYAGLFLAEKEDFGMVPLEYMSYGKPVIAVNEGNLSETITDGSNGSLVQADSIEIAEKILDYVSNPEKVKEMGENAHSYVILKGWPNFAKKLDARVETTWLP